MKLPSGISDGDYTSLYFKDAENQYEQIEGESKYGLRNMKDSLLKELKRDLMKLVKVDKAYSEMHRKSKPVPVRPGLALGVITLQVRNTNLGTATGNSFSAVGSVFSHFSKNFAYPSQSKFKISIVRVCVIVHGSNPSPYKVSITGTKSVITGWHETYIPLRPVCPPHPQSSHNP